MPKFTVYAQVTVARAILATDPEDAREKAEDLLMDDDLDGWDLTAEGTPTHWVCDEGEGEY